LWNLEDWHLELARPPDFGVVTTIERRLVERPEEVTPEFLEGLLEAVVELGDVVVTERPLFRSGHSHQQVRFAERLRPQRQFLMRGISVGVLRLNRIEDGVDVIQMLSEGGGDRYKDDAVTHDVELVKQCVELLAPVEVRAAMLVNPGDQREGRQGSVQDLGRQFIKRRERHLSSPLLLFVLKDHL